MKNLNVEPEPDESAHLVVEAGGITVIQVQVSGGSDFILYL